MGWGVLRELGAIAATVAAAAGVIYTLDWCQRGWRDMLSDDARGDWPAVPEGLRPGRDLAEGEESGLEATGPVQVALAQRHEEVK